MRLLKNKSVFISGGLSGIGKTYAIKAAEEGAIVDLKSDQKEIVMEELKRLNSKAIFIDCDESNFSNVKIAIDIVSTAFGSLNIALNNAGIGGLANKIAITNDDDCAKVIGINLTGVFYCMKHELTQMAKQNSGVIINMASILGKVGFSSTYHYVAAKHCVIGLTQTAALEYATQEFGSMPFCPGFIATPLLEKGRTNKQADVQQTIINMHPMKCFGNVDEIANGFIFFANNQSSFMTGSALEIDGGFLAQ